MDEQENNNSVASDLPIESIIETTDKVIQSSNESIIVSLQDTTLKVLEDTTIQKPGQEKQPLVNNEDRNLNEEANEVEEVEEEEEVEPKLIYERVANDCSKIFNKDSISCSIVYEKFLLFGTIMGKIYILDHQGNFVQQPLSLHATKVNDLSIEIKGEYIASCSTEKVAVHGLYSDEHNVMFNFDRPVNCVAIDPSFCKPGSSRRYITGDDRIVIHEKGFISRYKSTVLFHGDRQIHNIKWKDNLIAWASSNAVRIYDLEERAVITYIKKDADVRIFPHNYKCYFYWINNDELIIGWGSSVKLCKVGQRNATDVQEKRIPKKFVYIPFLHELDHCICGIAPFKDNNQYLLMTLSKDLRTSPEAKRPYIQVIEFNEEDYVDILSDIMLLRGYENYQYADYQLEYLKEDNLYFIISPNDVVIGKPREEDDHISWLIEKNRFEQALKDVKNCKNLRKHSYLSVGKLYLRHLLSLDTEESISKAAECSFSILQYHQSSWEEIVLQFLQKKQLHLLEPYLPIGEPATLSLETTEMILNYFLEHDIQRFLQLIRKWPPKMYDVRELVKTVQSASKINSSNQMLNEALAELHIYDGKYEEALIDYISINNREEVFDLIRNYSLIGPLRDKLEVLMNLNVERTSILLLENQSAIPIDYVVSRLKNNTKLLLPYLDKVFQKDPELCAEFHHLLVELYSEFMPNKLLRFLKTSNHYSLEKALNICLDAKQIPEVVFLLSRMGNAKKALFYIINMMDDINYAIEFCLEHSDPELWEELISHSLQKPENIRILIQNIGTNIPDPIGFINRIPNNLEIPGLLSALVTILHDYNLQISLEECCKNILNADCFDLMNKLNLQQKRGIRVQESSVCQSCNRKVISNDLSQASDVIAFNCKHVFHEQCLSFASKKLSCIICMDPHKYK